MHSHNQNEMKVKVAARQQTLRDDAALVGSLLLLILVSVVVLVGRGAGGM